MSSSQSNPNTDLDLPPTKPLRTLTITPDGAPRKIAIPIDLSEESSYAVQWAVQNYLRPNDSVTLIHVRPTSVLYGADWGSTHFTPTTTTTTTTTSDTQNNNNDLIKTKQMEDDFAAFTADKIAEVAQPLKEAKLGYKVHVVKDHDMKERLCLEIERLGMSVVIMGSRGFGASRRSSKGRLGSVSDYCVHHCACPVVVVRYPETGVDDDDGDTLAGLSLRPVPEVEEESSAAAGGGGQGEEEEGGDDIHLHRD